MEVLIAHSCPHDNQEITVSKPSKGSPHESSLDSSYWNTLHPSVDVNKGNVNPIDVLHDDAADDVSTFLKLKPSQHDQLSGYY